MTDPHPLASDGPDRRAWIMLGASFLLMTIGPGTTHLLATTLKPMAEAQDWPRSVPSMAYAAQYVCGGLGAVVVGYWMDRKGIFQPVIVSSILVAAGAALISVADQPWHLYLAYGVMFGLLGPVAVFPSLLANATHWFDRRRGMAIGVIASGQSISGTLWPPIGRYMAESVGWRDAFLAFGVLSLVTLIPLSLLLRGRSPVPLLAPSRPDADGPAGREAALGEVVGMSPRTLHLILCAASFLCCVAMAMPMAHIVAHGSDLGYPAARAAELLAVAMGTTFFTRLFLLGILCDRYGGLVALTIFSVLQLVGMNLLVGVEDLTLLYITAVIFGLGNGGLIPCYPVIVREYLPATQSGRLTGQLIMVAAIGMAVGVWLAGAVFDAVGSYQPAFMIGVAFNVANLALALALIRWQRNGTIVPAPA